MTNLLTSSSWRFVVRNTQVFTRRRRRIVNTDSDEDDFVDDILDSSSWTNSKSFMALSTKNSQLQHYQRCGASDNVLKLVVQSSKSFGTIGEQMISEIFRLGKRTSTQNDGTFGNKKMEIKCARYWQGTDDCVWQHLEPGHDYELVICALLDFHGWKVWGVKKSLVFGDLRDRGVVTRQGTQGWWVMKSKILPWLTSIRTVDELQKFIQ